MKKQANHVMIDLETMSTHPDTAIVSIGAVVFDPRANLVTDKTFYQELDWESQDFEYDRVISKDTQEWWTKQSKTARKALNGTKDLKESLEEFIEWIMQVCPDDVKVWGNGPNFDIAILESAFRVTALNPPWRFWNVRCCRTIKDMFNATRGGLGGRSGAPSHDALEDAQRQAVEVCKYWRILCSK